MANQIILALSGTMGALAATTPPEITQEDHIRLNFQGLIISIIFVAAVTALIYVLAKRSGKKRYAAHLAGLAAEGRLDTSNALSEIANGGAKPRFINDDDAASAPEEQQIGSIFGSDYRPYGDDGINAPGV